MFSLMRDAANIILYMGKKPLFGMSLPATFTFFQLTGVYFNNIRREQVNYAYNKLQNEPGIEGGH